MSFYLSPGLLCLDRFSFLIFSFTFNKTYLNFYFSSFKIYLKRNKSKTFLAQLSPDLIDLFPVEKQFSCSHRVMVLDIAMTVRADMAIKQKNLGPLYDGITVFKVSPALSQGFYLCAKQGDTGLIGLLYEIVMISLFIGRRDILHDR